MNDRPAVRRPFPLFFLVLLAFAGGVLLERHGGLGGWGHQPPGLGKTFAPFWEAWHVAKNHFVDREKLQPERMTQGAIEGMLDSLGDVGHTTYLTKEELQRLDASLKGELEGIGARMTVRQRRPTILNTMPGSPAREAGLRPGDVLVDVEGKAIADLPLQQVVEKVRGPAGTSVTIKVLREGAKQPLQFTIKRAKIEVPPVTWHRLPGTDFLHVAIEEFGNQADRRLRDAVAECRKLGLKGMIVDVRGNPGGLKEQAVAVTSEFLKEGEDVMQEQDAQGKRKKVPVKPGGVAGDLPVVVLMDEGTASSAEIFAGALQDYGRAKLVGTHTFGTGTVLQEFPLSDGSAVLLAVTEWLTPKGRRIWHTGVPPDVNVPLPLGTMILMPETEENVTAEELKKGPDKQLLAAIKILQEQTGSGADKAKDLIHSGAKK